jgi:hypothetical protein
MTASAFLAAKPLAPHVGHRPAAIPVAFSPFTPPAYPPASKDPPSFRPSKHTRLPSPRSALTTTLPKSAIVTMRLQDNSP